MVCPPPSEQPNGALRTLHPGNPVVFLFSSSEKANALRYVVPTTSFQKRLHHVLLED
jgi:hypothetical protein